MSILCIVPAVTNGITTLSASELPSVADCTTGYVAVQSIDYVSLSSLGVLFQQYFAFDEAVFTAITGGLILVFVSGHALGRMMQVWRKSF